MIVKIETYLQEAKAETARNGLSDPIRSVKNHTTDDKDKDKKSRDKTNQKPKENRVPQTD